MLKFGWAGTVPKVANSTGRKQIQGTSNKQKLTLKYEHVLRIPFTQTSRKEYPSSRILQGLRTMNRPITMYRHSLPHCSLQQCDKISL
jgi:hypothetical protein